MQRETDGRYFLFGVPSGVDDDAMKIQLGQQIGYPEGIREMHWWKPAADDAIGGSVRLQLDEKGKKAKGFWDWEFANLTFAFWL